MPDRIMFRVDHETLTRWRALLHDEDESPQAVVAAILDAAESTADARGDQDIVAWLGEQAEITVAVATEEEGDEAEAAEVEVRISSHKADIATLEAHIATLKETASKWDTHVQTLRREYGALGKWRSLWDGLEEQGAKPEDIFALFRILRDARMAPSAVAAAVREMGSLQATLAALKETNRRERQIDARLRGERDGLLKRRASLLGEVRDATRDVVADALSDVRPVVRRLAGELEDFSQLLETLVRLRMEAEVLGVEVAVVQDAVTGRVHPVVRRRNPYAYCAAILAAAGQEDGDQRLPHEPGQSVPVFPTVSWVATRLAAMLSKGSDAS